MKIIYPFLLASVIASGVVAVACAASKTQVATVSSDVLTIAEIACILTNSVADVPTIENVCAIIDTKGPAIQQLIAAHKAAEAREAQLAHDAGPGK